MSRTASPSITEYATNDPVLGSVMDDVANLHASLAVVEINRDALLDQIKG